jgi:protein-S-isoprenylcysteine O-methyltransferase Ste14
MTSRVRATVTSVLHFAAAPGVVVGLVPWLLTGWEPGPSGAPAWPLRLVGGLLGVAGVGVLVVEFVRFVLEGRGSPAPPVPTEQLVVGGLYRHVRNPMYVAVVVAVVGQALLFARPVLLVYAGVLAVTMWLFVRLYEEPTLRRRFGAAYDDYRDTVPGWIPRVRARWS